MGGHAVKIGQRGIWTFKLLIGTCRYTTNAVRLLYSWAQRVVLTGVTDSAV
jgi:hypothetical protein